MSLLPAALRPPNDIPTRLGALHRDTRPDDTRRVGERMARATRFAAFECEPHESDKDTGEPVAPDSPQAARGVHDTFDAMLRQAIVTGFGAIKTDTVLEAAQVFAGPVQIGVDPGAPGGDRGAVTVHTGTEIRVRMEAAEQALQARMKATANAQRPPVHDISDAMLVPPDRDELRSYYKRLAKGEVTVKQAEEFEHRLRAHRRLKEHACRG